jgi:hypothetical protein
VLLFEVGTWPPHDGFRRIGWFNLPGVLANDGRQAPRETYDQDGDCHSEPCHPVEGVASDVRFGPLIARNPGVKMADDDSRRPSFSDGSESLGKDPEIVEHGREPLDQ